MPLSEPAPREDVHTRHIEVRGYEREDGFFDIEGHLVDTKSYAFESSSRGLVEPGTPVHEMWIRLTVDTKLMIHGVEAVTDHGPYRMCPEITPNFKRLEGVRIGPGWNRKVRDLVGGTQGCTHIVEMLGQVATTAYQTLVRKRQQDGRLPKEDGGTSSEKRKAPPLLVNTCHAWSSKGDLVKKYFPGSYTGD